MKTAFNTMRLLLLVLLVFSISALGTGLWVVSQFPSAKELRGCITTKMYHIHLCPGSGDYKKISEISPFLLKSVVMTEDGSFFQHQGFDFDEMERSLKKNIQTKKYARGGSTISQQLSKNMFLTEEKTLFRKIKEALITIQIEKHLSKREILERYFNIVHWGKNIFGVQQAAQTYFQKKPHDLTIVESAFLTFLLPSPEKYSKSYLTRSLSPFAESRMRQIIDNLYNFQKISEEEYKTAEVELSGFIKRSRITNDSAGETEDDSASEEN